MSVSFGYCPSSECVQHERPPVFPDEANFNERGARDVMLALGYELEDMPYGMCGDLDAVALHGRIVTHLAVEPASEALSAVAYRPDEHAAVFVEGGQAAGALQRRLRVLGDVAEHAKAGCGWVHFS